jgi:hypothetical protein
MTVLISLLLNLFLTSVFISRTDSTSEEKSKFRPLKWSFTSFSKKMKNSKGVVEGEGVPLTEDLISQIYQLIDFLSLEPSKIPFSLNLF